MRKKKNRWPALMLVFVILQVLILQAAASGYSLTLTCAVDGKAVAGVNCHLYRVADLSGSQYRTVKEFQAAKVSLINLDSASKWQTAADSLAVYASAGAKENAEQSSRGDGKAAFSGLDSGLYLAVFDRTVSGNTTYRFSPALIAVPAQTTAAPKGSASETPTPPPGGTTTSVTVLKVWNDEGYENKRPTSLTVELLKDGAVSDTVSLTANNNWRHTWDGLSASSVWTVLEVNVPENYTVTYSGSAAVLTVTNSYTTEVPDTPTPGGDKTEKPTKPGTKKPTTDVPETKVPKTKLPQTGQLWWPVPVLAAGGLVLFAIGWRKRERDEA
jgi:hypothetical protein